MTGSERRRRVEPAGLAGLAMCGMMWTRRRARRRLEQINDRPDSAASLAHTHTHTTRRMQTHNARQARSAGTGFGGNERRGMP